MIWSIAVAIFLVTLVGLLIIGIILFWFNKFRKFFTFLQLSWSNTLGWKSPAIWSCLFDFFALTKGSANPFAGLRKALINVFWFLLHKSSIEIDSTSVLLILRSSRGLKFMESNECFYHRVTHTMIEVVKRIRLIMSPKNILYSELRRTYKNLKFLQFFLSS